MQSSRWFSNRGCQRTIIKLGNRRGIQTYLQPAGKMGSISPGIFFAINLGMQYSLSKDLSMDFQIYFKII
ncbi:MAG: hypothetical protein IPO62_12965 [Saprospiraceae bacterium]|nr:hypothetical protein [Saprospiraceae bacterium]